VGVLEIIGAPIEWSLKKTVLHSAAVYILRVPVWVHYFNVVINLEGLPKRPEWPEVGSIKFFAVNSLQDCNIIGDPAKVFTILVIICDEHQTS
jgi:hypothetical protein